MNLDGKEVIIQFVEKVSDIEGIPEEITEVVEDHFFDLFDE